MYATMVLMLAPDFAIKTGLLRLTDIRDGKAQIEFMPLLDLSTMTLSQVVLQPRLLTLMGCNMSFQTNTLPTANGRGKPQWIIVTISNSLQIIRRRLC